MCEERFPSLVLLEYHKEDEDHWSYLSEDDDYEDCKKRDFEAKREIMNDRNEDETEFGPDEEDKEMLVTSVGQ